MKIKKGDLVKSIWPCNIAARNQMGIVTRTDRKDGMVTVWWWCSNGERPFYDRELTKVEAHNED